MADMEPINWRNNITRRLPMLFAGKLMPVLFLLLITVIYSRRLSYEDYGKYQTMWVLISLAGTVLLFGVPSIILAWPGNNLWQVIRRQAGKFFIAALVLTVISVSVAWLGADDYSIQQRSLLVLLLLLQSIAIVTDTLFIRFNRLRQYLFISAAYAIVFFVLHIYFLYNGFVLENLMMAIAVLLTVRIIAGLFLLPLSRKQASEEFPLSLRHWLFTGLNEVAGMLGRWLDKIVLLYLLTSSEFAVYFNGSFEIPLFAVMISAVENIMLGNISRDLNDKKAALKIFRESFRLLSLVAFPIFCFFLFAHQEFYAVVFEHKYDDSIPVFIISLFIIPLRITHYGVILQCYGKGQHLLIGSVIDILLSLLLMLLFYPLFNTVGIMLALVISTYLQVIYYLFESAKLLGVKLYRLVPLKYLGGLMASLLAIFFALSFLRPMLMPLTYLIILFAVASLFVLAGLFRYFFRNKHSAA